MNGLEQVIIKTFAYGGVDGRNRKYGSNAGENTYLDASHVSRNKRLIQGISAYATANDMQQCEVIEEWEPLYVETGCSVGKLVMVLQQLGKLSKKKSRGRNSNSSNSSN